MDPAGLITGWPQSAARLSGQSAGAALGHDVRDVLLTSPAQRELARHAIAVAAAGRAWTETAAGGPLGGGSFAVRWEPLGAASSMVVLRRAWPQSRPGWLAQAAAGIGDSLDLGQTAAEVAAGQLRPADEVVLLDSGTPAFQAMATGQPVLFGQPDPRTAERLSQRPGGRDTAARYTSFLAVALTVQGTVVGCLTLGRTTASRAGHPPPLAVLPGGETVLLELPAGLPLGLGEEDRFEERVLTLPAGTTVALTTPPSCWRGSGRS